MNKDKFGNLLKNKRAMSYAGLTTVVFIWGISPLVTKYFYNFFSPSASSAFGAFFAFIFLLIYNAKKLKLLNKSYFKVAIPTGLFMGLASILQKIGLNYTTPTKYAFLENLSCVVVPFLTFWFIRKKPTALKIIASLICLLGAFVLGGFINVKTGEVSFGNFGIGEILCAAAGIFYGVNIAGTGAFAKKLESSLYVMIHMFIEFSIALVFMLVLNFTVVNGSPVEPIQFSFNPLHLLLRIAASIIIVAICWIIRTNSLKYVSASFVAIVMPFSAVITGVLSVIVGTDALTFDLIAGGILCLISIAISTVDDILENKKSG